MLGAGKIRDVDIVEKLRILHKIWEKGFLGQGVNGFGTYFPMQSIADLET